MKTYIPRTVINAQMVKSIFSTNSDGDILQSLDDATIMDMGWFFHVAEPTIKMQVVAIRKAIAHPKKDAPRQQEVRVKKKYEEPAPVQERVREDVPPIVETESAVITDITVGSSYEDNTKPLNRFEEVPKTKVEDNLLQETELLDDVVAKLYNESDTELKLCIYVKNDIKFEQVFDKRIEGYVDYGMDEIGSGIGKNGDFYLSLAIMEYCVNGYPYCVDVSLRIDFFDNAFDIEFSDWDDNARKPARVYNEKTDGWGFY